MREIKDHPILKFDRGKEIIFTFNGKTIRAYDGETIAIALYRNGFDVFSESPKLHHPRGMFCAIGKCSSCMMRVNGIPNVRTCIIPAKEGMKVESQSYYGKLQDADTDYEEPAYLEKDVAIVGSGPAGLSAAIVLKQNGINPIVIEQNPLLGGQLIKQTHKFFGSENERAGVRGVKIAEQLVSELASLKTDFMTDATAFAFFKEEDLLAVFQNNRLFKIKARDYIIATGASEKMLPFPGNDLPGVMGAGAAQTLMNVYGVKPGESVLMVGAGNVGLIVSYQMLQAGIKVKAVVEAMPEIGGYFVHAAKLRRFGVPIMTGTTIKEAIGTQRVQRAIVVSLDKDFREIDGTERSFDVDTICLSTGLLPSVNLLAQAGCELKYVPPLGGYVPLRNSSLQTTKHNIFVAGDVAGIEEASVAMLEGKLAAHSILLKHGKSSMKEIEDLRAQLDNLRSSPFSRKIKTGLGEVQI